MVSVVRQLGTFLQPFLNLKVNTTSYHFLTQNTVLRGAGTRCLGGHVRLQLGYIDLIHGF